jgi:MFS family permease
MQEAMHASPAELGIGLLGFDVGAFLTFPFASRFIERTGTRNALVLGLPFFALAIAGVSLSPNYIVFFCLNILVAIGFTATIIAMNVEADRIEFATGRRILNRCHGMWSLGFLAASVIGIGTVAAHVAPALHLLATVPVVLVATIVLVAPMVPSPPRPHTGEAQAPLFAMPTIPTVMLILFALSSIWLESGMRAWSVIYLRDVFHTAGWIAATTLSVAVAAQVVGRMFGDGWIERYGPVRVAMVLTGISFVGLVLVVIGAAVPLSLLGFALIGFGVATSFPQAMSAAARLGDRPASVNVAAISFMNSLMLFLTPPVMGFSASQWGIRASFALILPLPILAIFMARNLAERPATAPVAVQA